MLLETFVRNYQNNGNIKNNITRLYISNLTLEIVIKGKRLLS